ncbi:MAG: hypothetical protein HZA54_17410 [Planctomycetes bacterium]|nr:hypothetical protein [Planctomycetota bacterium]
MVRKVCWTAGVVALLSAVFGWSALSSWAGWARAEAAGRIEEAIPIEVQLGRLDQDVVATEGAIREGVKRVATSAFERDEAAQRRDQTRERRGGLLADVAALNADLKKCPKHPKFTYAGKEYTRAAVESDLRSKIEKVKVLEAHLASQERIVKIREAAVASEERDLIAIGERRSKLEIDAETLRAQHQELLALDTAGKAGMDTSRLAEAEKLALSIKRKLAIGRKMLETGQLVDEGGIHPVQIPDRSVTEMADEVLGQTW